MNYANLKSLLYKSAQNIFSIFYLKSCLHCEFILIGMIYDIEMLKRNIYTVITKHGIFFFNLQTCEISFYSMY